MRVGILSQYFPPDGPGRFADELSQSLAARGHSVRVLTTFPHYTHGKTDPAFRQRAHSVEPRGEVTVRRVPIYARHSRNPLGRIANYASFIWSAGLAKSFLKDADVIYVHGTPATVVQPAHAWQKSMGIPFVYCVQDIWPESVTGSGMLPGPLARTAESLISRWLSRVYSRAAAIVVIAPHARQLLRERGVPLERIHVVYNWARETVPGKVIAERPTAGLRLLYAGNLGAFQDLETLLRAVAQVSDLGDLRLDIAGAGVREASLRELVEQLGLRDTVRFLGRLDAEDLAQAYADSDFQLVTLRNLKIFSGTIPSKFQGGLAHGVPMITTVIGDVTRLVEEHGLGFTAVPEDVESLASAIRRAYATSSQEREALRSRARAFCEEYLTREHAVDRIEKILTAAAHSRNGARS